MLKMIAIAALLFSASAAQAEDTKSHAEVFGDWVIAGSSLEGICRMSTAYPDGTSFVFSLRYSQPIVVVSLVNSKWKLGDYNGPMHIELGTVKLVQYAHNKPTQIVMVSDPQFIDDYSNAPSIRLSKNGGLIAAYDTKPIKGGIDRLLACAEKVQ